MTAPIPNLSAWDEMQARDAIEAAAIRQVIGDRADAIAIAHDFGAASAVKRGRNPKWPYVPVIKFANRTQQLKGLAYATREEAVDRAAREIESWRRKLANDLCKPNYRAMREQYGLPRDIGVVPGVGKRP